jgi:hypothetical protein
MKLKRKNVSRLASISALGAGALGVAAGAAEAGTIQYTPLNHEIGFSATTKPVGLASSFNAPIVKGISAAFRRSSRTFGTTSSGGRFIPNSASFRRSVQLVGKLSVGINSAGGLIGFAVGNIVPGQKWQVGSQPYTTGLVPLGARTNSGASLGHHGDFYELFAFRKSSNAQEEYGWILLNENLSSTAGPDVTVKGIAFDNSGATIAAGATPEPSTAALASLSALALGAVGLRRWRAVRRQAA